MPDPIDTGAAASRPDALQLYLDLLKEILTNNIYGRFEYIELLNNSSSRKRLLGRMMLFVMKVYRLIWGDKSIGGEPLIAKSFDPDARSNGHDWPSYAYTMVGRKRLDNIQFCLDTVEKEAVPGDFVEAGIWRGGVCIFVTAYFAARGINNRIVWALDSFEGLPKPNADAYPADSGDIHHKFTELQVGLESVRQNFKAVGIDDARVRFVKGFFSDTAPTVPVREIAVLRMDGDMYESTIVILNNFYDKIQKGGFIVVDDYTLPNCRKAIEDYMRDHHFNEAIIPIDDRSAYWRKS